MLLVLIGFTVGTVGTLIGVGGGFMLVPLLLFMYPATSNAWVSAMSMWVVALNSTSGSIAYLRRGTVHLKAAGLFVLASLPGSVLGVWIERFVNRAQFEAVFGTAMLLYSFAIFFIQAKSNNESSLNAKSKLTFDFYLKGILISFFVGFLASFLGIGGGVVHVPLLAQVLGFPVHLATGTSHSILALTAWFTTAVHLFNGDLDLSQPMPWQLGLSAVAGAQLGAHLSKRVSAAVILRILAVALFLVGLRLVWPELAGH